MADNPNDFYYYGRQGTLSGFDAANLPGTNPDPAFTGWSIDQLKAYLLNDFGQNFPSQDWVNKVDMLISQHIDNLDNPHEVTLDQIASDIVRDVMSQITPGTPPNVTPFFSYDAVCELPLGDVFPMTYSNTNTYRMTEGGTFVDTSTEIENIALDFSPSHPGIPLFSSITNVISPAWYQQTSAINTTVTPVTSPPVSYPFPSYLVSETYTTANFGITLASTETGSSVYTLSFIVLPSVNQGSLILSQPSDSVNFMTVSMTDGTYTLSTGAIQGETFVYASGAIKISFSFTTKNTPDNAVQIIHQNQYDTVTTRQGVLGRPLFTIMAAQQSLSMLNQPFMVNGSNPLTTTPATIVLTSMVPTPVSNLMGTITVNIYPILAGSTLLDKTVFKLDALTITRDLANLYVNVAGVSVYNCPILNGLNILSFSYSPTSISVKNLASPRQTIPGTYPSLTTTSLILGPCAGYLNNVALYATADQAQALEYLTNG